MGTRRFFAAFYEWIYPRLEPAVIRRVRRTLAERARGRVLEIGVGTGLNLPYYGPDVEVHGIDPDPAMLAYARVRSGKARLTAAPAEELPYPGAFFDTVVATFTFCTVREPDAAAREVRRVLRRGGSFLFMEHILSPVPGWARWQRRLSPLWRRILGGCHPDRATLETFAAAGLRVVELHRLGGGVLPVVWGRAEAAADGRQGTGPLSGQPLEDDGRQGGNENRRKEVADADLGHLEQIQADAGDDQAAGGRQLGNHPGAEVGLHRTGGQRQRSLVEENGYGGEEDADAHGGGEDQGGDPVQQGFGEQRARLPCQSVLNGPENGHGPHAEDQGGRDESAAEGGAVPVISAETGLKPPGEGRQPPLDVHGGAHGPSDNQAADYDQGVFGLQGHLDAQQDHRKGQALHHCLADPLRQAAPHGDPGQSTQRDGRGVNDGPSQVSPILSPDFCRPRWTN